MKGFNRDLKERSTNEFSRWIIDLYLLFGIERNMTTDTSIMLESGAISMAAVLSCVSARRERDDSTNGDKA